MPRAPELMAGVLRATPSTLTNENPSGQAPPAPETNRSGWRASPIVCSAQGRAVPPRARSQTTSRGRGRRWWGPRGRRASRPAPPPSYWRPPRRRSPPTSGGPRPSTTSWRWAESARKFWSRAVRTATGRWGYGCGCGATGTWVPPPLAKYSLFFYPQPASRCPTEQLCAYVMSCLFFIWYHVMLFKV